MTAVADQTIHCMQDRDLSINLLVEDIEFSTIESTPYSITVNSKQKIF